MRRLTARLTLAISLFAVLAGATAAAPAAPRIGVTAAVNPPGWQDELVDKLGLVGQGSSLALDSNGFPHIAYYDFTQHGLKYAGWDGVAWTLDTVERDLGPVDGNGFIPLRSGIGYFGGTAYIVYQKIDAHTNARYLRYASGGPGGWNISTIGPVNANTFAYAPALQMDGNHNLHVSYTQRDTLLKPFSPDVVMYARLNFNDTNWLIQSVASSPCCTDAIITSLALDPANRPQIAYSDNGFTFDPAPLRLASWNGSSWLTQTVAVSGTQASLAVDVGGHPRLTYLTDAAFPNDRVTYAVLTGTTWLTQSVTLCDCNSAPLLALDALERPTIVLDNLNNFGLEILAWDGAQWNTAHLPQTLAAGDVALALDSGGNAHVSYLDREYDDLHHIAWGPTWISQTIALAGSQPSLALDKHAIPYISYEDSQLKLAHWTGADEWQYQTVAALGAYNSLQLQYGADQKPLPVIGYQDGAEHVNLAQWTGTAFLTQTVDHGNFAGYDLSMALNGPQPVLAYFEHYSYGLNHAEETSPGGWAIRNDAAQPPSNFQSGVRSLSLGVAPNCCVSFIAYRDGVSQTLRLARWDGTYWTDQVVDANGNTGLQASLAVDRASGQPAIAYYDATHQTLKYAVWRNNSWISDTVDNLLQDVTGLSLQLGLGSDQYPRIAYTVKADNSLRLAWTTSLTGTWTIDTVGAFAGNPPPEVALRIQQRDHLAFSLPGGGIDYAARAATLPYDLDYNPLQPCVEPAPDDAAYGPALARVQALVSAHGSAAAAQLDDLDTLRALRDLFALSPGGQHYISLYYTQAAETGMIGIANPALAWDTYRTLQNFLPGAQALLAGQGDQVTITPEMVDQANDIFDRLSAAGTPALQAAIASERAKYTHLQAFAGKSFAEAAALIGVASYRVYLPSISKH